MRGLKIASASALHTLKFSWIWDVDREAFLRRAAGDDSSGTSFPETNFLSASVLALGLSQFLCFADQSLELTAAALRGSHVGARSFRFLGAGLR